MQLNSSPERGPEFGILLVNLGSPSVPTARAVRRYLGEFLSDPRVVELPRWLWKPILHGIILRIRPRRSARLYKKIWTKEGSPLLANTHKLGGGLQYELDSDSPSFAVEVAMRYGDSPIASGLRRLYETKRILVLPLYPQYSATTTASVFDTVFDEFKNWRRQPELRTLNEYHLDKAYIKAIVNKIAEHWKENGRGEKLLFSFHGIPERCVKKGDPYADQCRATVDAIVQEMGLEEDRWLLTFQSRFGKEPWLQPYTDKTLQALPGEGTTSVDIVCPGFAVDCLETLEEIDQENREIFLKAGGKKYNYIPCLNDDVSHAQMLKELVYRYID